MNDETFAIRLVEAIQASPHRDLEIEPSRAVMPVPEVGEVDSTPSRKESDAMRAEMETGLADVAAGRVKDFDAARIVERGMKLLASRSPSA
jgi:hypothetical protein